ncbi:lipoprotein LpqV [Mycolicibacterium goodii]|uniref:lipoprotein LpqV n=1 Tax=Mycolicibacterium goodii TaxID=134601 RepID=UPI001BDD5326|nr:lipoprotein LpqV [Mycolicibacterium goodii]MBU8812609.1 lipoprotein LpqV [Mycolicibacterium goodii]
MRSYPWPSTRAARVAAVVVAAGLSLLTACGSDTQEGGPPAEPPSPGPTSATSSETPTPTAAPGEVAVSPGGVTTAVGAPAQSTEEEYFQACHAAKVWMDEKGGDPKAQIEPYLASLQAPDAAPGPGTYDTTWAELEPARQAAVIVAVQAAADDLCG